MAARPELVPPPTVTLTWKLTGPAVVVAVTVADWVPNGRAAPLTPTVRIPAPPEFMISQFNPTSEVATLVIGTGLPLNVMVTV